MCEVYVTLSEDRHEVIPKGLQSVHISMLYQYDEQYRPHFYLNMKCRTVLLEQIFSIGYS